MDSAAAPPCPYAAYAVNEAQSKGRRLFEAAPQFRSQFQRDRDRIIHCSAFRRLEYKTQVFVNHEGDMFRTRLTHSLEVAQIARVIARALGLNEDLTETISLAHDLGHTPFGHAGQSALNECMASYGGFEHNFQSLRVVEKLEQRYPEFSGLNLLYESREGILKHCSVARANTLGPLGQRFIEGGYPSLEAQLANLADEIAYNHHDIDDGLRADLLDLDSLREFKLFDNLYAQARSKWKDTGSKKIMHSVIRAMLNHFVGDLILATQMRLAEAAPSSLDEVRTYQTALVDFSPSGRQMHLALKRILRRKLYNHPRVAINTENAGIVVSRLFNYFFEEPAELPEDHRGSSSDEALNVRAQRVADYVAGMTDRFAIGEHERLFGHRQFAAS